MNSPSAASTPRYYEAIIKVNPTDEPGRRAHDIEEGLAYATALLHDEYGWSAAKIIETLERLIDCVEDDYGSE